MRYLIFYLLFCGFVHGLSAQKYDNIWMGGTYNNFYIDFTSFPPSIYPVTALYDFSGTLTFMSDINGIPSFYSNGCSIHNASHQLIENGDSLLHNDYFCSTSGQMNLGHGAGVTLPDFLPQHYVMFTRSYAYPPLPGACETNRLLAHYIDMSANNGAGKVIQKEEVLLNGCLQEPSANRHANGRDWWILLPDCQQGRFFRWLLTPSGLQGPWEQVIPNPILNGFGYCGWSEFSSDGTRYMINTCYSGIALYNFDRCTGLLDSPILIKSSSPFQGPGTFSPDSKLLYSADSIGREIVQYDLTAADIEASKKVVATWDGILDTLHSQAAFGYMQQGPDGKIYIWPPGSYYMHFINFPNRLGTDCAVHQRAIQTLGYSFALSLYYPRYRLGPVDGSSCDTLGIDNHPSALFRYDLEDTLSPLQVTFTDASSYEPTAWHWTFGDGTMSQDTNPVHSYAQPGIYTVCLIASNAYSADTFCRQVTVGTAGIQELPVLPQARVSPNPFSQEITVHLPALLPVELRFVLSDLYGRTVTSRWLHDFETTVALPDLPAGVYVWQLFWKGTRTQQGKMVKVEGG